MEMTMKQFHMKPFQKYVVLKVDLFESEIIDECNFGSEDTEEIMRFQRKYIHRDDCVLVKIQM